MLEILEGMKQEIFLKREPENRKNISGTGRHSGSRALPREGGCLPEFREIDVPASVRSAALHRTSVEGKLSISDGDLRLKRFRRKKQVSILFLVDASRSQGSKERLSFAKSAVLSILEQVYSDRDRAGMAVFGNRKAELVLPLTKSVEFAAGRMEELKTKGNTPLAMGIRKAIEVLEREKRKNPEEPGILVILTDGKANFDTREGQPSKLVLEAAGQLKKKELPVLVIDTENSIFGMGMAETLADAADARYVKL